MGDIPKCWTNEIISEHIIACMLTYHYLMILKDVKYFTKLIYEGMPNNSVVWGKPHLNCRSCFDLCGCIKMTYHHECTLHCCFLVIYCVLPLLLCFGRSRSWSAPKFFDESLLPLQQQGKTYFPFFVHTSWPMFFPKYFYT